MTRNERVGLVVVLGALYLRLVGDGQTGFEVLAMISVNIGLLILLWRAED